MSKMVSGISYKSGFSQSSFNDERNNENDNENYNNNMYVEESSQKKEYPKNNESNYNYNNEQ